MIGTSSSTRPVPSCCITLVVVAALALAAAATWFAATGLFLAGVLATTLFLLAVTVALCLCRRPFRRSARTANNSNNSNEQSLLDVHGRGGADDKNSPSAAASLVDKKRQQEQHTIVIEMPRNHKASYTAPQIVVAASEEPIALLPLTTKKSCAVEIAATNDNIPKSSHSGKLVDTTEHKEQAAVGYQGDAMPSDESSLVGGDISSPSNNSEEGKNESPTFDVLQPLPEHEPTQEDGGGGNHPAVEFATDEELYDASDEYSSSSSDGNPPPPPGKNDPSVPLGRSFASYDVAAPSSREESLGSVFAAGSSSDEDARLRRSAKPPRLPNTTGKSALRATVQENAVARSAAAAVDAVAQSEQARDHEEGENLDKSI